VNEFAERKRATRERDAMAERVAGRRAMVKAILGIVAKHGVDDEEAYRRLRRESMRRRVPVETIARELLEERSTDEGTEEGGRPGSLTA
jgi:AmiR/NasT family two-component response regulator